MNRFEPFTLLSITLVGGHSSSLEMNNTIW